MLTRTGLRTRCASFAEIVGSGRFSDAGGNDMPLEAGVKVVTDLCSDIRRRKGSVYLVGNGGSAAVASHAATDFFNRGGLRAHTLHDPSTLTCLSNDYGYEHAFANRLDRLLAADDLLIAISSSGSSANILNAAQRARACSARLITLTGFDGANPLREMGDINYWLDSDDYGMVEIGHLFLLHHVADILAVE
ncbi:SIS domain-containing protein [Thiohalobacter sp. IOR34]|uniref:SIS domain-containing protein n=1 Tax=Thiohalobacter sp. IOR34 TaxID=3057176 RepID=UPI0025AF60B7|nr:SIS domain-containing protein [Thiohalobacter sp. IOR34]WJW74602.1 SIS domain-containing protein [Thiohalobacter sp. IOR34]